MFNPPTFVGFQHPKVTEMSSLAANRRRRPEAAAVLPAWVTLVLMNLVINGQSQSFESSLTLADLIDRLGMKADRVAVELNREIVARAKWPEIALKDGDQLEIVHFVGGG
jgi:sulfur carrier protein